jgi:hypothetical protein
LVAACAILCTTTPHALAAVVWVNSTTNNGSFETGALSPWTGGPGTAATIIDTNASLASDGSRYLRLYSNEPLNPQPAGGVTMTLPSLSATDGQVLQIEFDWHAPITPGASGFPNHSVSTPNAIQNPPQTLSVGSWIRETYLAQLQPAAFGSPYTFSIFASAGHFTTPHSFTGEFLIDNVKVTQVPEPASLVGAAGLVAGGMATRRRPRRAVAQ